MEEDLDGGRFVWRMEDGAWRMEHGAWSMEDGGWRIEDGGWRKICMEDDLYGGWRKRRKSLDIIHLSKSFYLYLGLSSKSGRVRKMNDL